MRESNSSSGLVIAISDNKDVSVETRQLVERICFAGVTTILCLLGLPANVMNCLVFWTQGLRHRMNLCLFYLALTDFFFLMCGLIIFSLSSFVTFYDTNLGEEYFLQNLVYLRGAFYAFRLTSGCVTMIITLERCVCVVFPLHAATLVRTSLMGFFLFLSSFVFQTCFLLSIFSRRAVFDHRNNSSQWMLVWTEFYEENKTFIHSLVNIVLGMAVPATVFSTISVATIITVVKLKTSIAWRKKSSCSGVDSHSQETALTSMLVAMSCVYIITMMPFVMYQVAYVFALEKFLVAHFYNIYMMINAVVNCCPLVNSSIHFFVYYLRSSRFRQVFHKMFYEKNK